MEPETVDVLVVGLGPAGASAALAAAGAGAGVLAVDRRTEAGTPVQCAELIPAMLGAPVAHLGRCVHQAIEGMRTFIEHATPFRTAPFRGLMIDRGAFDAGLVAAAREAGADVRMATAVQSTRESGEALLSNGASVRARAIIGADGPLSPVGRAIGRINQAIADTRQQTFVLAEPSSDTDIFLTRTLPGGYGWLFPAGRLAHVGVGADRDSRHLLKAALDRLVVQLRVEGRITGEALRLTGGAIPAGGLLDPVGQLGETTVLLAGDAAGLANPVTGAGINAAIVSGGLAGQVAAQINSGDGTAAAGYAEELRELFSGSLARAVRRRAALMSRWRGGADPSESDMRRGWIAFPEYWEAP